ncbi:MAG: zf-HC2 domain-containing protein [Chloroflexi bacterium]|nr:zf-HC2 domain-containing protein [Chloroflexota bacterium]
MNAHLDTRTLNLYLDDALDAALRADADAHLAECAACRAELEQLREVFAVFETWRNEPIPRDVSVAVMARVRGRPAPFLRAQWGIVALAVQAALAALLIAWGMPLVLRSVTGLPIPALGAPAFDWSGLQFAMPFEVNIALPLPAVSSWVWALVLLGAGIFWLVGNRLVLYTLQRKTEASQ